MRTKPVHVGDVLELIARPEERVEVVEIWRAGDGTPMLQIRYPDDIEGADTCPGVYRHARQPLDPTPPGPPIEGDQPDLLEMLEATP